MTLQKRILILGCGFLGSHLVQPLLPFASHFYLVDDDRVEQGNYDSALFPKGKARAFKVTALGGLISMMSPVPVTTIATRITSIDQLQKIHATHHPEFAFVTFDNLEGRELARQYAVGTIPTLFLGVTEHYAYVDWADHVIHPTDPDAIARVKRETAQIHDVCERIEFRGLGTLTAALAYDAFYRWLTTQRRVGYIAETRRGISVVALQR